MTNAVILAAGRGSRLGSMTEARPKCLVELAGQPLLLWQAAALNGAGLRNLLVVTGYRGDMIAKCGFEIISNDQWQDTNMVASLLCAWEHIKQTMIVSYSDIVYDSDVVDSLLQAKGDICISYDPDWLELWRRRFEQPLDDAESFLLDGNGRVIDIGRKVASVDEIEGQYMGLLKISPRGMEQIEEVLAEETDLYKRLDMTGLLNRLIAARCTVKAVACTGSWCEVDSGSDLAVAEALCAEGRLIPPAVAS